MTYIRLKILKRSTPLSTALQKGIKMVLSFKYSMANILLINESLQSLTQDEFITNGSCRYPSLPDALSTALCPPPDAELIDNPAGTIVNLGYGLKSANPGVATTKASAVYCRYISEV
jgi:hypothetical protein